MIVIALNALSMATVPLLNFGPFKIFVLSQALRHGWRRSLPLALTPLVADIPVILLVLLVLRQLPGTAIELLRLSGGFFFIYLATVLCRSARTVQVSDEAVAMASRRTFWQAATAIWITPPVYINWTAIGVPALLRYSEQALWRGLAFLVAFYVLWCGGLALQIVFFSQAGKLHAQANVYLITAASLLLVAFGIYQIWLGATALLRG